MKIYVELSTSDWTVCEVCLSAVTMTDPQLSAPRRLAVMVEVTAA